MAHSLLFGANARLAALFSGLFCLELQLYPGPLDSLQAAAAGARPAHPTVTSPPLAPLAESLQG